MSPKTAKSAKIPGAHRGSAGWRASLTPGRITMLVLAVLTLVFIFENTQETKIRLLIPEVTMPLWAALLATALIGALCGAYFCMGRRRR
ncbi:lipopolysaccharide assembly protein LapA domain-containing protein [Streptomyces sp. NBC_00582]|uniref:lipopolysaccharide assembly protein LapA domain-containing protein n=1 Tax=Streptomyces sp. NBC_00582 TaxID=2975783 RepID=UPI001063142B|nr:lipopolysaccharide assembly protein LapA domain-containing protein [Streptomyces sp. NBC_00582]WUB60646.1 lipopolysaccharide assembly protein LapA domain-containing protein [Streptomyces sp. NBC_00582]